MIVKKKKKKKQKQKNNNSKCFCRKQLLQLKCKEQSNKPTHITAQHSTPATWNVFNVLPGTAQWSSCTSCIFDCRQTHLPLSSTTKAVFFVSPLRSLKWAVPTIQAITCLRQALQIARSHSRNASWVPLAVIILAEYPVVAVSWKDTTCAPAFAARSMKEIMTSVFSLMVGRERNCAVATVKERRAGSSKKWKK